MEWNDIRTALSRMAPPFPRAAAEESRLRWDELAPLFIAEFERVADGGSTLIDELNWEHDGLFSFAVYLAAEKRDSRAYGPLVRTCHCSTERAEELFGDDVGNQIGRMLASVCGGDIAPLKALAEDRAADMWCRYAALRALTIRVVEGDADRDDVLAYIEMLCEREADLLRQAGQDEDVEVDEFLTWAIDTSLTIGSAPLLEKIRGWFDEGLIDPMVTGLKWFEKMAAMPVADCLGEAAADENNRYIRDALSDMATWICYDTSKPRRTNSPQASGGLPHDMHSADTLVRKQPKVGRNDPCPCGSGKKFKKCCGG